MPFATTELSDAHPEAPTCEAGLLDFGGTAIFDGPVVTIQAPEDNSKVRAALEEPGQGRVLVVDGGGSRRCALLGDQLGGLAVKNGWAGVVVYGCVRDTEALARLPLGVKALGANPKKSAKHGRGERDVSVTFLGVRFTPGSYLY